MVLLLSRSPSNSFRDVYAEELLSFELRIEEQGMTIRVPAKPTLPILAYVAISCHAIAQLRAKNRALGN